MRSRAKKVNVLVLAIALIGLTVSSALALELKKSGHSIPDAAYGVVSGDFTGDGTKDVIAIGDSPTNYLLEGTSDGKFSNLPTPLPSGAGAGWGGVAGRFDSDKKLDLVVADVSGSRIVLLRGKGDGTFKAPRYFGTLASPQSPAAADFDGDGNLDVAVAAAGSSAVNVLMGKGDGTFEPESGITVPSGPYAVAAGRIDDDKHPDIVSANNSGNSISTLLWTKNGFKRKNTTVPGIPEDVAIADFNRDGKNDVVTANYGGGSVSVLLGKGDGTFKPAKTKSAGGNTWHVDTGFVNDDKIPDVIAGNETGTYASLFLGKSDGTLKPQRKVQVGSENSAVLADQLDGKPGDDLAVTIDDGGIFTFRTKR